MIHLLTTSILALGSIGPSVGAVDALERSRFERPSFERIDHADGGPAREPYGAIFRREIDQLIASMRTTTRTPDGLQACGPLHTAKYVTALGHSHRHYALSDGPVMRVPIEYLLGLATSDGAFDPQGGDSTTVTRWVIDALSTADPVAYAIPLRRSRAWLGHQGVTQPSHWREHVREFATSVIADFGGDLRAAGQSVMDRMSERANADARGTIDDLVTLVAVQELARRLDAGGTLAGRDFDPVAQRGLDFLRTQQTDGTFFVENRGKRFPDTGLTGLGLAAMQTKPVAQRSEDEQEIIAAGLAALRKQQNEDGSFGPRTLNYSTCAAVLALAKAGDPQDRPALQKAQDFLTKMQNVEARGYEIGDRDYGSMGYGGDERGDLSNLGFAIEALHHTGLTRDDEAFAKAIVFLQRTQNLREFNDLGEQRVKDEDGEWHTVTPGDDGGAVYYPGNSAAGYDEGAEGTRVPRSYGSMTYMLLRTYTLCGLTRDDPRVQRAVQWVGENWTLEVNPGASPSLGEDAAYQGLYYYYMVIAQALAAAQIDPLEVRDADGARRDVDWRAELATTLAARQRDDGSWVNEKNGRWWESQPAVCTIFSLLALEHCHEAAAASDDLKGEESQRR